MRRERERERERARKRVVRGRIDEWNLTLVNTEQETEKPKMPLKGHKSPSLPFVSLVTQTTQIPLPSMEPESFAVCVCLHKSVDCSAKSMADLFSSAERATKSS
jgi:hypothetical protein